MVAALGIPDRLLCGLSSSGYNVSGASPFHHAIRYAS
jgi:hypothetical protein